jgi:hypothetical protein
MITDYRSRDATRSAQIVNVRSSLVRPLYRITLNYGGKRQEMRYRETQEAAQTVARKWTETGQTPQ